MHAIGPKQVVLSSIPHSKVKSRALHISLGFRLRRGARIKLRKLKELVYFVYPQCSVRFSFEYIDLFECKLTEQWRHVILITLKHYWLLVLISN